MWPFDDDSALPLREGVDVGGAQERQMAVIVGGYGGVRTVEERNPDGSITTLRTRGGNPIFETTAVQRAGAIAVLLRGFVAKATSRAVLFDPYTLEVLNANYTLATSTYTVLDFATAWNVPTGDDTDWYDVVLFDGTTIKVNAKAMPTLGITANHGYPAIPYVINRETAEDQYGNAERNTTEKRVFAVGRSDVKAWGGGGVTETLTPTAPRSESRAMTIGQRLDFASDKAWLGQLYHPAAGWDAAGEWYFTSAEVTMLLASAYLVKVAGNANVAMSPPSLSYAGASSGTLLTPQTFPPTPTGMYTSSRVVGSPSHPPPNLVYVQHGWAGVVENALQGQLNATYDRDTYSGTASSSETQAGRTLDYSASNIKEFDARDQFTQITPQTLPYPGGARTNGSDDQLSTVGSSFHWDSADATISALRGKESRILLYTDAIYDSNVLADYETQTGTASVVVGATILVSVSWYRETVVGDTAQMLPNTTYYDGFLANPYGLVGTGSGMGIYSQTYVQNKVFSLPPGITADDVVAELQSRIDARAAQTTYDDESTSGDISRPYGGAAFYYRNIVPIDSDTSALSWSSKDFLLYDETNEVYITVEGTFAGVNTAATLDVILKVETRFGTTTQALGEYSYTYSQLVQEREIGSTGKYAMPSPQIRAIFAPLYQEQGSFKGAHYVTQDEEGDGATPAHLFNFLLYLRPYGDIGTINDDNLSSQAVHFVPCNLLEMLYAFVFSQEYGVAESGERYPVTFTTRYNDMMNTLFSSPVRVAVRDGAQVAWSDAFGPDFASIPTVSLHRV